MDNSEIGVRPEEGNLLFELGGQPEIIGIQEGDEFAPALADTSILRRRLPGMT
jgi:hypothetical protein